MQSSVQSISFLNLSFALIPLIPVIYIFYRWHIGGGKLLYALVRMLLQLLVIGYFLTFIFETEKSAIILLVLTVMLVMSSWIALNTVSHNRNKLFIYSLVSIFLGGVFTLFITSQAVLEIKPWYKPSALIPLAGMIFSNAMNSVSLAIERLESEMRSGHSYKLARDAAFKAALIPVVNSLFAVGLVSLPGMMTGQILSGVSPFIAARYQIMVMCMIVGSAGISTALFLVLVRGHICFEKEDSTKNFVEQNGLN